MFSCAGYSGGFEGLDIANSAGGKALGGAWGEQALYRPVSLELTVWLLSYSGSVVLGLCSSQADGSIPTRLHRGTECAGDVAEQCRQAGEVYEDKADFKHGDSRRKGETGNLYI